MTLLPSFGKTPVMSEALERDLSLLKGVAFQREENVRELVKRFHTDRHRVETHPDFSAWQDFYPWLFCPLALWPIPLDGLGVHLLDLLTSSDRLDAGLNSLIKWLGPAPRLETCRAVSEHELAVKNGNYESLVLAHHKFNHNETTLLANPEFRSSWNELKSIFPVKRYQNKRGIIRRRMVQERNFRSDWEFDWKSPKARFKAAFDAFCYRWRLYGMEGDKPLLLKLSVNITPHGTLIMIPRYWNLNVREDLDWKLITKLHRSRGVGRQGMKIFSNAREQRLEALRVQSLHNRARANGLKGRKYLDWIINQMGWPAATDKTKITRLLKKAAQFKE